MINQNVLLMSLIACVILITFTVSWRKKNRARNSVLCLKAELSNLLNEAEDLLDANPEIRPPFFDDMHELWAVYVNMFDGVDLNSFDVCWVSVKKETESFKKLIIAKIAEIQEDIQILKDAKVHVPLLFESLPSKLSEVRRKILKQELCEKNAKLHLDHAHGWFNEAYAVMRQDFDHALAWGMLRSAEEEIGKALSFNA